MKIIKEKKCTRCGRQGMVLSNGYCPRCDSVVYGVYGEKKI